MPSNSLYLRLTNNPKKFIPGVIVITLFIVVAAITIYNKVIDNSLRSRISQSTAILSYDLQLKNHQYMYSQPVNFNGVPLTLTELKDYAKLSKLPANEVQALVAYLNHRVSFADDEETQLIKQLVTRPYFKSNDSVDFLRCRVNDACDFNALIERFPSSPWETYWILLGDIGRIGDVQEKLNKLQISALGVVKYFENENRPILGVVPPALAESLVIIPFMENCTQRQQDLMLYLYEVKAEFPPMLDLVDYYIEQAKYGECE